MATWVTHLMVADRVLEVFPNLCRKEFCVGNIAPDCNVENEDWSAFTPSREVTHWMKGERKNEADCDSFLTEYLLPKLPLSPEEESFLWGYYAHLLTDAKHQEMVRNETRVKAVWQRVLAHPALQKTAASMEANWDSVKKLVGKGELTKDVALWELEYLNEHPNSGFLTEIVGIRDFPDYLPYLPKGAIPRKVGIMGYPPKKTEPKFPSVPVSKKEYEAFIGDAVKLVIESLKKYRT